jgi:hypothetical protein
MPQPAQNQVHINRPLTNISTAYIQDSKDFIADKVFPMVPVEKRSDLYFTYAKDFWFRTQAQKRADSTESAGSGFTISTDNYFCDVWAVHKDIGDQIRANTDMPINLERDTTQFVMQQLLLRRELQFFKSYFVTNTWTGNGASNDFTPAVTWDSTGSTPINDIDFLKNQIKRTTGKMPNTLVVTPDIFTALKNNASILDRIKYTQRGMLTEDLLASIFGVDKFLVAYVTNDTTAEGLTASYAYLISNMALLVYAAPSPSILQPTGGYIFTWNGFLGAGAFGNRIKSFRLVKLDADRIEGEMAYSMKLVGPDLGVLLNNVLTTA